MQLKNKVRQCTDEMAAANQKFEVFSYSVVHDLQVTGHPIDDFTRLLEKIIAIEVAERLRHYMHRIRAAVRQRGALTGGLLSLAQVSRTKLEE